MKILVIGGTGFIGGQILKKLIEKGHDINVFHRGKTKCGKKEMIGAKENLLEFRNELKKLQPLILNDVINYSENEANWLWTRDYVAESVSIMATDPIGANQILSKVLLPTRRKYEKN